AGRAPRARGSRARGSPPGDLARADHAVDLPDRHVALGREHDPERRPLRDRAAALHRAEPRTETRTWSTWMGPGGHRREMSLANAAPRARATNRCARPAASPAGSSAP